MSGIVPLSKPRQKYLLCWPLSGLNDLLNRVWRGFVYAKTHHRTLVIDSQYSFLCDAFDNYFHLPSTDDVDILSASTFYEKMQSQQQPCSIFPPGLTIADISGNLIRPRLRMIDKRVHTVWNDIVLSASLEDGDRAEDVVVYASCGGGPGAIHLFRHCHLTEEVIRMYTERRNRLPSTYHAFHIRNTDKRSSDLEGFLASHHDIFQSSTVFVASDDVKVLTYLRNKYTTVVTFANIPKLSSVNIHYHHPTVPTKEFNMDTIVDLLLLASATAFTFSCPSSGYSKLANALFQKKDVLHRMLCINHP